MSRRTYRDWLLRLSVRHDQCVYCGEAGKPDNPLTEEHMVPRSRGGTSAPDNIVTGCARCNRLKSDRTPEEFLADLPAGTLEPHFPAAGRVPIVLAPEEPPIIRQPSADSAQAIEQCLQRMRAAVEQAEGEIGQLAPLEGFAEADDLAYGLRAVHSDAAKLRLRQVVRIHESGSMSLAVLGRRLGVSRQRAHQLLQAALEGKE